MSALTLSIAIGALLGFNGRLFSWIVGGVLVLATTLAGLLVGGISPHALIIAGISILGYNLGLSIAVVVLLQEETAI